MFALRALRLLFTPRCKHLHDGKVCTDPKFSGGGVTLTHHSPTRDWRGNPGPDGPRQPISRDTGPDGVKGPDGVRD